MPGQGTKGTGPEINQQAGKGAEDREEGAALHAKQPCIPRVLNLSGLRVSRQLTAGECSCSDLWPSHLCLQGGSHHLEDPSSFPCPLQNLSGQAWETQASEFVLVSFFRLWPSTQEIRDELMLALE